MAKKKKPRRSIKSKIISYMLLVSLVPIIGVAALVYINMSSTRDTVSSNVKESRIQLEQGLEQGFVSIEQNNIGLNLLNISELMLSELSWYVTERIQDIRDLSWDIRVIDALTTGNTADATDLLKRYADSHTNVSELSVSNMDGATIILTSPSIPLIVSHKNWWQAAGKGDLYIGEANRSSNSNAFDVQVAMPVESAGSDEIMGIFGAVLTIDPSLMTEAWGIRIPQSSVMLVDQDFNLIMDSSSPDRHKQADPYWTRAEQEVIEILIEGTDESGYVIEEEEVVVFSNWKPGEEMMNYLGIPVAPNFNWSIMMKIPSTVAFAPFNAINAETVLASLEDLEEDVESDTTRILAFLMMILALVSVVVLILALWVSRGLTGPIIKLHQGALAVMSGNLDHRVNIQTDDEIGELSRAFDEMMIAIYTAQGQLKNYSKSLERMVESRTQYLEKEIADRQRAEKQLLETHTELKETHEELKASQEQLLQSAKLAAVGQLVSGVAHEVNNPLMAISGNAEMLLKKTEDEKTKKRLRTIYSETNRAIAIVRNLLSFARKRESEQLPISINEVIDSIIQLRSYDMSLEDIAIMTELDPELPDIQADFQQMQQVFLNLMINAEWAIKAAGNSGQVTIRTEKVGEAVRVEFSDNGTGIPKKILGRIFEPFFTTKDVGEGTGLGLSICYGIVQDHKGKISVESKEGEGTKFTVELPVVKE